MDHLSGVTRVDGNLRCRSSQVPAHATGREPGPLCLAEQAIFTSIRTPMGEGYRLIAMSPGITAEERAEITKRSPSHGSICDPDPAAAALASYTLGTQRQCVAWTRYAGKEHTARGGQRVHTHLVVLDPSSFDTFACDPFRVQSAMLECLGPQPDISPNTCLEPLELCDCPHWPGTVESSLIEHASAVARRVVMSRGVLLVIGDASAVEVARWCLSVLPQAFRKDLAFSANLQYAPARQLRLTCVGQETPELRRCIQGQDVETLDLRITSPRQPDAMDPWFSLLVERNRQARLAEFCELAGEMESPLELPWLDRIVAICRDADRLGDASKSQLEELVAHYGQMQCVHPVESRLIRQFLSNAVRRAADLQHAADAAPVPSMAK
jgi:hypothetical protein